MCRSCHPKVTKHRLFPEFISVLSNIDRKINKLCNIWATLFRICWTRSWFCLSKVSFNWKARGYWPESHMYLIGLNFRGIWLFGPKPQGFLLNGTWNRRVSLFQQNDSVVCISMGYLLKFSAQEILNQKKEVLFAKSSKNLCETETCYIILFLENFYRILIHTRSS